MLNISLYFFLLSSLLKSQSQMTKKKDNDTQPIWRAKEITLDYKFGQKANIKWPCHRREVH